MKCPLPVRHGTSLHHVTSLDNIVRKFASVDTHIHTHTHTHSEEAGLGSSPSASWAFTSFSTRLSSALVYLA